MATKKVDRERRAFNQEWKQKYIVKCHSDGSAIRVICNAVISVLKEYSVRRHYTTRHSTYDQYQGKVRKEKYDSLNRNLQQQQIQFTRYKDIWKSNQHQLLHFWSVGPQATTIFTWWIRQWGNSILCVNFNDYQRLLLCYIHILLT